MIKYYLAMINLSSSEIKKTLLLSIKQELLKLHIKLSLSQFWNTEPIHVTGNHKSLMFKCKNYVAEEKSIVQHDKHLKKINNEKKEKKILNKWIHALLCSYQYIYSSQATEAT